MPELTLAEDPALYKVEATPGVHVHLSALELSAAVIAAGGTEKDTNPKQLIEAVEKVATPKDVVESLTSEQKFAIGARVATHFERASKDSAS